VTQPFLGTDQTLVGRHAAAISCPSFHIFYPFTSSLAVLLAKSGSKRDHLGKFAEQIRVSQKPNALIGNEALNERPILRPFFDPPDYKRID
jgi:hypothetical protein